MLITAQKSTTQHPRFSGCWFSLETADSSSASQTKQSGLTVAISNPIIDALQTGFNLAQAASKSSNGRTQALAIGSAALTALNTYNAVQPHTGADGQSHSSLTNVTVSATYGTSKSSSTSNQHASTSVGSTIQAGGNVNISATGAGQNSNIAIIGSDINAGHSTNLTADNQLNILSADNAIDQSASHKSSSIAAGVSATFGSSGIGIGGTISGSTGKGHGNGQDISHSNSHINSQQINISTGGDTTLRGAILNANRITGNIGGNLSIESQQDTSTYTAKDKNLSASITAGAGVSGSASYNSSKINNDYASVKEQTGLFAGNGGYQLTVKGHTSLTGGAITSSQSAIDQGLNTLNTGSLEVADINNHADYSASSMGISLSGGIAGKDSKDNTNSQSVHLAQQSSTPGGTMGYGSDSGHASSTTRSALSQGSVTFTDPDKTSASQAALARVDRSTSTETQSSGYIAPNFNQTQVIDEVTAQRDITQTFGSQAAQAIGDYANHKQAQDLAKAQLAASQGQNIDGKSAAEWQAEAGHWSEGGAYRIGLHALAGGATGGLQGALGAAGASAAAPAINQALVDMGVQGTIAGQVIGGAAAMGIGYATGGMSGAASGFNEDANNRQLHQNEAKILDSIVGNTKDEDKQNRLIRAACSITHCAAGVPKSDPNYEGLMAMQEQGARYTTEIKQLKKAGFGGYTKADGISDVITHNSAIFPSATSPIEGLLVINSFRYRGSQAKPSIPAENQARLNKESQQGSFNQKDATQIQSLTSQNPSIAGTPQYAAYQRLVASTDGSNSIYTVSPVSRAQGLMTNDVPTQIGDIVHTDGGNLAIVTGRNADGTFRARLTTEQEDPRISGFANHTQLVSYATGLGTNLALAAAASTPLTGESSKGSNTYSPRSDVTAGQAIGRGAGEADLGKIATSSMQKERLGMQLFAEQAAGARAPTAIESYSEHATTQIIGRDGGIGVNRIAIKDAFTNPLKIQYVPNKFGPTFKYTGKNATVVVNSQGKVVTTWGTSAIGVKK